MQQHIPAWRRIGLKLKYAKDPWDDASTQQYQDADSEITGVSNGDHEADETTNLDRVRPPKKRKLSSDSTARPRPDFAKPSDGRSLRTDPRNAKVGAARGDGSNAKESSR
jgi:hypothetical protein